MFAAHEIILLVKSSTTNHSKKQNGTTKRIIGLEKSRKGVSYLSFIFCEQLIVNFNLLNIAHYPTYSLLTGYDACVYLELRESETKSVVNNLS